MKTIRSCHAATMRADRTADFRASLAPTATDLHIIAIKASCQRARDARAKRQRQQAEASRRHLLRVALPAWVLCAVITVWAVL